MDRKVVKNTSAYMLAGMLPYAVNFFLLPVYTRYLEPGDYGALALLNTLAALLLTVLNLQMGNSYVRFYYDLPDEDVPVFVSTVFRASLAVNVVLMAPFFLLGSRVAHVLFPAGEILFYPHVFLALLGAFFTALVTNFNLLLRVQERGRVVLGLAALSITTSTGLQLYLVVVRRLGAAGVLTAIALNAMLVLAAQIVYLRSYLRAGGRRSMVIQALRYSWPLIPMVMSAVVLVYTDKLVLGYFVPLAQIGLYSIAQRIAMILELAIQSFKDANAPMFMRGTLRDRAGTVDLYKRLMTRWAALMSIAYLGLAFYAREVIVVLTAPAYHEAHRFVPVLAGGYLLRGLYFFCVNALLFEKRTAGILVITVVAATFNIGANLLLIPRLDVMGAAIATLCAHGVTFGLALLATRAVYPLRFEWGRLAAIFGVMTGCAVLVAHLPTDNLWTSLVWKTLILGVYAAGMFAWQVGDPRVLWNPRPRSP